MKDHEKFIEAKIQPIYNSNNAMLEFSTGLVYLAVEKLVKDSAAILADDAILAKTIGEVLSFETELRTMHNYPSSQPSAPSPSNSASFLQSMARSGESS